MPKQGFSCRINFSEKLKLYLLVTGDAVDMGCYMDDSTRDLEYFLYDEQWAVDLGRPKYDGLGVNRCVGACAAMGFMYAGKIFVTVQGVQV